MFKDKIPELFRSAKEGLKHIVLRVAYPEHEAKLIAATLAPVPVEQPSEDDYMMPTTTVDRDSTAYRMVVWPDNTSDTAAADEEITYA